MRLSRKVAVATAIAGAVSLLIPSSSYALGVSVVAVTGGGSINPGLGAASNQNTVTFGGTAVGVAAGVSKGTVPPSGVAADVGQITCNFAGGTTGFENAALGQGTVTGNCTGAGLILGTNVAVTCPALAYERIGNLVIVQGDDHPRDTVDTTAAIVTLTSKKCTVTATGPLGTVVQTLSVYGLFNFIPTDVNPTRNYLLTGFAVGLPLNQILNTL